MKLNTLIQHLTTLQHKLGDPEAEITFWPEAANDFKNFTVSPHYDKTLGRGGLNTKGVTFQNRHNVSVVSLMLVETSKA